MATELTRRHYYMTPTNYERKRGCFHESRDCAVFSEYMAVERLTAAAIQAMVAVHKRVRACKRCAGIT